MCRYEMPTICIHSEYKFIVECVSETLENRQPIANLAAEIARLNRTYRRVAIAIGSSSGLSHTEFGILWHLKLEEDFYTRAQEKGTIAGPHSEDCPNGHPIGTKGGIRINDIATILHLSQSVISRQVASMEERGLTSRTPDPQDARATFITLSDKGRTTLKEVIEQHSVFTKEALETWSDDDIEHVTHILERLSADMRKKLRDNP